MVEEKLEKSKQNRVTLMTSIEMMLEKWSRRYDTLKDTCKEGLSDFFWFLFQKVVYVLAVSSKAILEFEGRLANLAWKNRQSYFAKRMVTSFLASSFSLIIFLATLLVLSVSGMFAGVLGLRTGKYSLLESIFAWWPLLVVMLAFPFFAGEYRIYQMSLIFAYIVILLGLNILVGYSGQASLGHSAFVLIGAYVTILMNNGNLGVEWPLYVTIPLGGLAATCFGLILGLPAIRVKGPYLGLITLGFASIVPLILKSQYLIEYSGGPNGVSLVTPSAPEGMTDSQWVYFCVFLPSFVLLIVANFLMKRHKIGRGLALIRSSEELARSLGVNVFKYKLIAFALSALYAGIGGGLLAILIGIVTPNSFTLNDSIGYLTSIAVGGLSSIFGTVLGAIFFGYQNEVSQWMAKAIENGESLQWGLFGCILVFIMVVAPRGAAGEVREWVQNIFGRKVSRYKYYRDPPVEEEVEELLDPDFI